MLDGITEPLLLKNGILNPAISSLISRVRHTNRLVIADRGFPFWPQIETVDISLVDDIPRVLDVFDAIRANFSIGRVFMAEEFLSANELHVRHSFERATSEVTVVFEPHDAFKTRVPGAIGLIRTADTIQYANMIIESA
jgi:D-ribose pyranase